MLLRSLLWRRSTSYTEPYAERETHSVRSQSGRHGGALFATGGRAGTGAAFYINNSVCTYMAHTLSSHARQQLAQSTAHTLSSHARQLCLLTHAGQYSRDSRVPLPIRRALCMLQATANTCAERFVTRQVSPRVDCLSLLPAVTSVPVSSCS